MFYFQSLGNLPVLGALSKWNCAACVLLSGLFYLVTVFKAKLCCDISFLSSNIVSLTLFVSYSADPLLKTCVAVRFGQL